MKAVIAHRDGTPRVVSLPEPALVPHNVLIRVTHCAVLLPHERVVLDTVADRLGKDEEGVPLGMMCSGILDGVGEQVSGLKEGLRVAAFGSPYVYHAGVLSVPARLVVELPKKVNHEEGAFAGLGAMAIHAFRASGTALGETLLVFGAGMLGLLVAQVARAAGVTPILVDESDHRLAKARNVGIAHAVLEEREALVREVDKLTRGLGADAAMVTPDANAAAGHWAVMMLRTKGRLVMQGGAGERLPARALEEKELALTAVHSGGPGHGDPGYESGRTPYPRAEVRWTVHDNMLVFLDLLAERKVQVSPLVSDRMPLERADRLYEKIRQAPHTVLGAMLTQ
ncbi:MAG: zinc-binding alcohol dehydrogenase [Candidatus Sumerlaeia bacterium]|nr:zinc-binding alcohol dehydrogenase [Candidatus Sumerlaeia bacterium]